MRSLLILSAGLVGVIQGHIGAYHKGMYCIGGTGGKNQNAGEMNTPLVDRTIEQWWFHHYNGCDNRPPKEGDFLELPAGGEFIVEMASNQAFTTLSYNGRNAGEWINNKSTYRRANNSRCIVDPNLHTEDEKDIAGSAFAISYHSEIKDVTPENLVVFSVNVKTPWKRIAKFKVPKDMPACPEEGCTCAWGWIPRGCGQANMYMVGFKCKVTKATSVKKVGVGKPAVWCEGEPGKCVKGPKQMLFWKQKTGNNVKVEGKARDGKWKFPGYSERLGFKDGAQNDIFV